MIFQFAVDTGATGPTWNFSPSRLGQEQAFSCAYGSILARCTYFDDDYDGVKQITVTMYHTGNNSYRLVSSTNSRVDSDSQSHSSTVDFHRAKQTLYFAHTYRADCRDVKTLVTVSPCRFTDLPLASGRRLVRTDDGSSLVLAS